MGDECFLRLEIDRTREYARDLECVIERLNKENSLLVSKLIEMEADPRDLLNAVTDRAGVDIYSSSSKVMSIDDVTQFAPRGRDSPILRSVRTDSGETFEVDVRGRRHPSLGDRVISHHAVLDPARPWRVTVTVTGAA